MTIFDNLFKMTGFGAITPCTVVMWFIGFILLYLGIKKKYEPLLLVPIAFGLLLVNFPGVLPSGESMGVVTATDENGIMHKTLIEIAKEHGILNFLYYSLIKTGFLPPIIFMGVGAMTDFGPMLRNLRLAFFGAAAQIGIFTMIFAALFSGLFDMNEASALGIIGGADGPTAIYTTIILADHLLGPIAIAAYSYMALVPVVIPMVVKLLMSKKELKINMREMDKKYPKKREIKNIHTVKILFPIILALIIAILVPSALPLVGMLLFGNLLKEIGESTSRLSTTASGPLMNIATIFLGLCVGATMTAEAFFDLKTIGIIVGGFFAFAISIAGGIISVKVYNLFAEKKINPLIGATGLSAVPMASRVANEIAFPE